jgi:Domain of unknown function (DUF4351)
LLNQPAPAPHSDSSSAIQTICYWLTHWSFIMIDHDQLFKRLLSTFFFEFIDLFLPDMAAYLDRSSISFLDKELFAENNNDGKTIADLVIRAKFRDCDSFLLVHVELQAQHLPDFGRRLHRYFTRLHEHYDLPVYPIAVFSFARPYKEQPGVYEVHFPDLNVLRFHYRTVQLNRLNWRHYVRHKNPVAAALMAKMEFAPKERHKVKLECLRLIATLNLDHDKSGLIWTFVDSYLSLTAAEQRQFDIGFKKLGIRQQERIMVIRNSWLEEGRLEGLKEGRKEGRKKGLEKGLEKGRQEGRQEGRHEGAILLVSRLFSRRFGPLKKSTQAKLRSLSVEQLEQLNEAFLDFETVDDFHSWLASAN